MRSDYAVLAGLRLPLPALALIGRDADWAGWIVGGLMLPAATLNVTAAHAARVQERGWHASPLACQMASSCGSANPKW